MAPKVYSSVPPKSKGIRCCDFLGRLSRHRNGARLLGTGRSLAGAALRRSAWGAGGRVSGCALHPVPAEDVLASKPPAPQTAWILFRERVIAEVVSED